MNKDRTLHHIDRTYTLNKWEMTDAQWAALDQVYRSLPGFAGYVSSGGCPLWFGPEPDDAHADSIPHLWASVEPSGLQVSGYLELEVWELWEQQFLQAASEALGYTVRDAEE